MKKVLKAQVAPVDCLEVSEIQLSYRNKVNPSIRPQVRASRDANEVLMRNWDADTIGYLEKFFILLMNRANRVIGMAEISTGGTAGTVVDPKVVFSTALLAGASSIIVAHNHPSGNVSPSQSDIELTRKLKEAGRVLDVPVLDHLIVTELSGFYSFADEGLI